MHVDPIDLPIFLFQFVISRSLSLIVAGTYRRHLGGADGQQVFVANPSFSFDRTDSGAHVEDLRVLCGASSLYVWSTAAGRAGDDRRLYEG
mmetsp:Transcript_825/g.1818  ORF Transcript_825/g.1818 Transcript_825/m.1818 type:complete len:91 (-) Transcript_825:328-600(-)